MNIRKNIVCDETLLQTIADMQPKRMVYVSCDPATLARDVKRMGELGYQVEKVAVVPLMALSPKRISPFSGWTTLWHIGCKMPGYCAP